VLLREDLARLLTETGLDVVAQAVDADDLLRKALAHQRDIAIVDIQMPSPREHDGLAAAIELRSRLPQIGILVLSQFYEPSFALELIGDRREGSGTCARSGSAT
jgi:DNA-binding NarL/FixJ family response regulator